MPLHNGYTGNNRYYYSPWKTQCVQSDCSRVGMPAHQWEAHWLRPRRWLTPDPASGEAMILRLGVAAFIEGEDAAAMAALGALLSGQVTVPPAQGRG